LKNTYNFYGNYSSVTGIIEYPDAYLFYFEAGTMPENACLASALVLCVNRLNCTPQNQKLLYGKLGKNCSFNYTFISQGKGCINIAIVGKIKFND